MGKYLIKNIRFCRQGKDGKIAGLFCILMHQMAGVMFKDLLMKVSG
jgi:hypothetical protein